MSKDSFKDIIDELKPEIKHLMGHTIVPAKAFSYKRDSKTNKIIENIPPKTHEFENYLREDLKKALKGVSLFPTKKEVFVVITYGINSEKEYSKHDLDNRAKTILDALEGAVYLNDSQVKVLWTYKKFLKKAQTSYCLISVKILTKNKAQKLVRITSQMQ